MSDQVDVEEVEVEVSVDSSSPGSADLSAAAADAAVRAGANACVETWGAAAAAALVDVRSSSPPPVKVFDIEHVKDLVVNKKWEEVEDYIKNTLSDNTDNSVEDFAKQHPSLFLILREEKIRQLVEADQATEAEDFYNHYVLPLKACTGMFVPTNIEAWIDSLEPSKPPNPVRGYEKDLMDYNNLYFPKSVGRKEPKNPLHQFVDITNATFDDGVVRRITKCLACGWNIPGLWKIKSHFERTGRIKQCPKVTNNVLSRIKGVAMSRNSSTSSSSLAKRKREISFDQMVREKAELIPVLCAELGNLMKQYVHVEEQLHLKEEILKIDGVGSSILANMKHDVMKGVLNEDWKSPSDDFFGRLVKDLDDLHEMCYKLSKLAKSHANEGVDSFLATIVKLESEVGAPLRSARLT